MTDWTHNPGSDAAIEAGCTCAISDNCHGAGFPIGGQPCFYVSADCPLHASDDDVPDADE